MANKPVWTERRGDIALIVVDNPPVNALSQAVRQGLRDAVAAIADDTEVRAAVLVCAGRTFIAGADIKEFGKAPLEPSLPDVIAELEASRKPIAAAIHGTALGGGFEVALGCHYRVMASTAQVGLPEVKLGIIPGAGGTQRLPRLTGVETAMDIVTSGRRVGSDEAVRLGLADAVAVGDPGDAAIDFIRDRLASGDPVLPVSRRPVPPADDQKLSALIEKIENRARGQLSPVKAAESVRNAITLDFADGIAREREIFSDLVTSDQSKALRYAFFGERTVSKVPGLEKTKPIDVTTIGIVGAGTMGAGIAAACADAGYTVIVTEMTAEAAEAGRERIAAIYDGLVKRGRLDEAACGDCLSRIDVVDGLRGLSAADLVIEAAFEDLSVKIDIFEQLDAVAADGAVLATNTSYLNVNDIAATTRRPESVCGMHFFSPPNVMKLLEIVRAEKTGDVALQTALTVGRKLGKVAVVSGVCDGFIGNRIWSTWRKQAEFLIEDGAYPENVDQAITDYGFPMGPFAVYDLSGLDIAWAQRKRHAATRDPSARYVELPDLICEMGRFGRKTGAGWYDYGSGKALPDPVIRDMIDGHRRDKAVETQSYAANDIQTRMLATMVNEGARILEEGIALRPVDIDMVMLFGYGYPSWRGGPMFEADRIGLPSMLDDVRALCEVGGRGWEPAPLLVRLVEDGRNFADWSKNN